MSVFDKMYSTICEICQSNNYFSEYMGENSLTFTIHNLSLYVLPLIFNIMSAI